MPSQGKPFGEWSDMDACVADIGKDDTIEDPEAYCASIMQAVEKGEIGPGDKVMSTPTVMFMSLVETPAVADSVYGMLKTKSKNPNLQSKGFIPFLQMKGDPDTGDVDLDAMFKKEHIIFAPALIPGKKDGNDEICFEEQIVKASIDYMENGRLVDENHDFKETENKPVYNWILRKEHKFEDMDGKEHVLPKGTWVPGLKINNVKTWEDIQAGKFKGFSIAGNWGLYEMKGKKDMAKKEDIVNITATKDELEQLILEMVQKFEMDGGVAVENIELDRGDWGENESYEDYRRRPVRGATINALVKSKSRSKNNSKDVEIMEKEEFDAFMKEYESAKANEEESKKKAEDEKALKADLAKLKEENEKMKKDLEELKAKQDDEEEDEYEEEDDEEKKKEEEALKAEEEKLKNSLKALQEKRKSSKVKRLKSEVKPKDDGVSDDGAKPVDINKKALEIKHEGSRGFKAIE